MSRKRTLFTDIPAAQGAYYILNTKTDHIYVGQTRNMQQRCVQHRTLLTRNTHHNKPLQDDWNLFGAGCFEFGVLLNTDRPSQMRSREAEDVFVRVCQSDNPLYGYNLNHYFYPYDYLPDTKVAEPTPVQVPHYECFQRVEELTRRAAELYVTGDSQQASTLLYQAQTLLKNYVVPSST